MTEAQVPVKPAPAPPQLLAALKSRDAVTRRDAANQLGALRARDSVRSLTDALSDADASVREAAAFALGQIADPKAVERLTRALADKDAEVRSSAAFALGMIGDRRAISSLSDALTDDDAAVRSSAAVALGLMQDQEAVDELIALLNDSSFDARYDAVWALGQISEPDAEDPLRGALASLDAINLNNSLREAFRQAINYALDNLRTAEKSAARPRRATVVPQTQPMSVRESVQAAPTERALRARIKGTVSLKVLVSADGRAARAYVVRRLGYGLDQRAVEAVLQYRFNPAMKAGLPQTSWMDMEVKF
ncbi:MAG TPA: TonB family protein [Blastocatellia bacterium]|nr:TonB family protein [Blastocatellia bacterium]